AADVARIGLLWSWAIARTGGPWLGGPRFSAVDAFYAPVAFRFREYGLEAPGTADYAAQLLEHPAVGKWHSLAKADVRRIACYEELPDH
ncbi:MAG TPA: glutathione S-transferase C-terminal domain-containing protein, partial [Thermohalobaculum sp.]|nr:glutathione S-transferase C-terminal domain-containing protein [Thermohalobaculum sp.]